MSDIAVVGGGIVGASAALAAAKAGASVTLIDAGYSGQATAAGAGVVSPMSAQPRTDEWYELAFAGAESYAQLVDDVFAGAPPASAFRVVGSLIVGGDEDIDHLDEIAARYERLRAGFGTACLGELNRLDLGEPSDLFPGLSAGLRGLHLTGVVRIDGEELTRHITQAAVARGVQVCTGTGQLIVTGTRVGGVRVGGQRIEADAVVLASGAWAVESTPQTKATGLPVTPQRGQIAHLQTRLGRGDVPIVASLRSRYMVAFPEDRLIVGATVENDSGFDTSVTVGGVSEVLGEALRLVPDLHSARLVEVRTGFRPVTPDGLPLIGPHPNLEHLILAAGLGSNGLLLGPHLGACAAVVALGDKPASDLGIVSPERHAINQVESDRSMSNV